MVGAVIVFHAIELSAPSGLLVFCGLVLFIIWYCEDIGS